MRTLIAISALITICACTTKEDVLAQKPLLDEVIAGDFREVGPCVHSGIQSGDYFIRPDVQIIPAPTYMEIQTTASSGYTGTAFGQITRLTNIDGKSFRALVQATYAKDGRIAVEAVRACTR